jgi:hypothetical protein
VGEAGAGKGVGGTAVGGGGTAVLVTAAAVAGLVALISSVAASAVTFSCARQAAKNNNQETSNQYTGLAVCSTIAVYCPYDFPPVKRTRRIFTRRPAKLSFSSSM